MNTLKTREAFTPYLSVPGRLQSIEPVKFKHFQRRLCLPKLLLKVREFESSVAQQPASGLNRYRGIGARILML